MRDPLSVWHLSHSDLVSFSSDWRGDCVGCLWHTSEELAVERSPSESGMGTGRRERQDRSGLLAHPWHERADAREEQVLGAGALQAMLCAGPWPSFSFVDVFVAHPFVCYLP